WPAGRSSFEVARGPGDRRWTLPGWGDSSAWLFAYVLSRIAGWRPLRIFRGGGHRGRSRGGVELLVGLHAAQQRFCAKAPLEQQPGGIVRTLARLAVDPHVAVARELGQTVA